MSTSPHRSNGAYRSTQVERFNPLLRGKRILLVSGWISFKLDMFQHIYNMGVKLVILDKPNPAIEQHVEAGLFEAYIKANIDDSTDLDAIMQVIHASGLTFDGVTTLLEFYTPLAAQIAAELDLPGHALSAVNTARNKYETRKVCEENGLPSPRFALINSQSDLAEKAKMIGFPCVLKPSKGTASTDVFYVYDQNELEQRYQYIVDNQKATLNQAGPESVMHAVWLSGFQMILEEYLDGDEFDVDCLLYESQMVFSSITSEKPQPHMIETGAYLPARYPQSKQDELINFAEQVLSCIGFSEGVFHLEFKYTSRGPRLIEVNARVGGGPIYQMVKRVWGVDLIEQYLLTCLGMAIHPQKSPEPLAYLASHIIIAPYSGIVLRDDFLKHLQHDPRVVFLKVYANQGQHIHGPENRVPEWLGEIIVCGDSPESADLILDEIVTMIELPLQTVGISTWEAIRVSAKTSNAI